MFVQRGTFVPLSAERKNTYHCQAKTERTNAFREEGKQVRRQQTAAIEAPRD